MLISPQLAAECNLQKSSLITNTTRLLVFLRLQNQQQQEHQHQQQHPIVQMPQVLSSACAVFPQNNLLVLLPASVDVFLHGDSERIWDEPTNDASSSSSKIPELKHSPDEAENQLTFNSGMDYIEEYWTDYEFNLFDNIPQSLQNQHEEQKQQPIVPNNNLQVLPSFPITTFKFFLMARTTTPCKYGTQCYWE